MNNYTSDAMASDELSQHLEKRKAEIAGFQEKNRRAILKKNLLASDPTCAHCGRKLVAGSGDDDSAHLVVDRLSCFEHVQIVRANALTESHDSIVTEPIPKANVTASLTKAKAEPIPKAKRGPPAGIVSVGRFLKEDPEMSKPTGIALTATEYVVLVGEQIEFCAAKLSEAIEYALVHAGIVTAVIYRGPLMLEEDDQ